MNARVVFTAVMLAGLVPASKLLAQAPDAKTLYEENCRKCHGVRGTPPKTMKEKFPKIVSFDAAFVTQHSADSIVKILTKGKNADMVSFKDKLNKDQMLEVANYVRDLSKPKP